MKMVHAFGRRLSCVAVILCLTGAATAQTVVPTPLRPRLAQAQDALTDLPALTIDGRGIRDLTAWQSVRMTDFPLPGGETVDLQLERVDLERLDFGYRVNGRPAPGLADGLDLTVWTGVVSGVPGSEAVLGFSNRGVYGWVRDGSGPVHLLSRPSDAADWSRPTVVIARDDELAARGLEPGPLCAAEALGPAADPDALPAGVPPGSVPLGASVPGCSTWECRMAIETDEQLYGLFNDLGAETAYLTTLLAAVSARYQEQVDTLISFPYVQLYTTGTDPWITPDVGGDSIDMLFEFIAAWAGNLPAGAQLGHFLSGANLGGGVALLGGLCDASQNASFAVSGNLHGQTPFPIAVGPLNWDFTVIAHETGHSFGSPHTHDYAPPIDSCVFGNCISDGTLMSYCHLCPGGMSNITTYFHEPTVVDVMRSYAAGCLPTIAPLIVDAAAQPDMLPPAARVMLRVDVQGSPSTGVDLNYRMSGESDFDVLPMAGFGKGTWTAPLPNPACGDTPEWYFSTVDKRCGLYRTETFRAEVGVTNDLRFDDLEQDTGWAVGWPDDDATTGIWERGDPIGTGVQPDVDVTPDGSMCWFTGQGSPGGGPGENDVDGGKTTLLAPPIALGGADARIGYWRWYSNNTGADPGTDVFRVQITDDGVHWVDVETVGPDGPETGGGWIYHEFTVSHFVATSANVQVRFIASDEGGGSLVEAAVDEFHVYRFHCGRACQAERGYGGPGTGRLSVCGGDLSSGHAAMLDIVHATPNGLAVILAGGIYGPTKFKNGTLVPVPWFLASEYALDANGALRLVVPGGAGPFTLLLQAVYTDASQAFGLGITNAVEVKLKP
ncbi:MAG: M12 family metallo-peptidase [Planctomycetota bacterium]